MIDQLAKLNEDHLRFLTVMGTFVLAAVTIMTAIITVQVRKLRERQLELGFKEDLLRRGMTVDDAVRLMTCRRSSWSQSLISLGDWTIQRFSRACDAVIGVLPRLWRPCRRLLRSAWRTGSQLCRSIWQEARPLLRWSMNSLSRCVHWFGEQTDRLVRRLAPHRP